MMGEDNVPQWTTDRAIYYPFITETAISPDGSTILFAQREPLMVSGDCEEITHLYRVSSEGGEPLQLTFGKHSNRLPRWSPDGQYIGLISTRTGNTNIYVMRASGGEAWSLTALERGTISAMDWSPDGWHIAFLMARPQDDAKATKPSQRSEPILHGMVYAYSHLYQVAFSVGPRELPLPVQITGGRFHVLGFDWLADGATFAILHRPRPVEDAWPLSRLAVVSSDTAPSLAEGEKSSPKDAFSLLTDLGLVAHTGTRVEVSPDGGWIACVVGDKPVRWTFSNRINLFPVDGGQPRKLAQTPNGSGQFLGWSSDAKAVYLLEAAGVSTQLWRIPVDGSAGSPLTDTATLKTCVSVGNRNHICFVGQDFHEPNAIHLLEGGGGEREVWQVRLPSCWPASPLPRTDVIRWQSKDGVQIDGILVYPQGYVAGKRYPLVVHVHGGPASAHLREYLGAPDGYCNAAGLSERGFLVLKPNPRGSDGYGREFRFANYGDWGGGDYEDPMAGVEFLTELGMADPDRLGIMGWSYGGYLASLSITKSNRFKAACVGAAMTNLASFSGTADIPSIVQDYLEAEPWEGPELYWMRSAVFRSSGAKTPTLIQHGAADVRVPVSQGHEFFNALKRQGVPVELVIYPGQGHTISDPCQKVDRRRRAVEWMVRWLSNKDGIEMG